MPTRPRSRREPTRSRARACSWWSRSARSPRCGGLTVEAAQAALSARDLTGIVGGASEFDNEVALGNVLRLERTTDGPVRPGSTLTIIVSRGPDLVEVPDVVGRSIDEAVEILEAAGFRVILDTNVPPGLRDSPLAPVQSTNPAGGERGPPEQRRDGRRELLAAAELLGHEERELERLHVVQARVAQRLVARREGRLVDVLGAAEALGDVVAGELDVDAARVRADRAVRLEEALDLVDDVVEATRLVAVRAS